MINLESKTKFSSEEVIKRLKKFFGKEGHGMAITDDSPLCVSFSGGGGYVTATFCTEEGKTRINLVAQEWEYQAKEFIASLG